MAAAGRLQGQTTRQTTSRSNPPLAGCLCLHGPPSPLPPRNTGSQSLWPGHQPSSADWTRCRWALSPLLRGYCTTLPFPHQYNPIFPAETLSRHPLRKDKHFHNPSYTHQLCQNNQTLTYQHPLHWINDYPKRKMFPNIFCDSAASGLKMLKTLPLWSAINEKTRHIKIGHFWRVLCPFAVPFLGGAMDWPQNCYPFQKMKHLDTKNARAQVPELSKKNWGTWNGRGGP